MTFSTELDQAGKVEHIEEIHSVLPVEIESAEQHFSVEKPEHEKVTIVEIVQVESSQPVIIGVESADLVKEQ